MTSDVVFYTTADVRLFYPVSTGHVWDKSSCHCRQLRFSSFIYTMFSGLLYRLGTYALFIRSQIYFFANYNNTLLFISEWVRLKKRKMPRRTKEGFRGYCKAKPPAPGPLKFRILRNRSVPWPRCRSWA